MTAPSLKFSRPLIFGIINVTPDSFSDGGEYLLAGDVTRRIEELLAAGADYVDVGAESTRPGAQPVSQEAEWSRLAPVLQEAKALGLIRRLSVDTRAPQTMLNAAELGVRWINCVGPLPDDEVLLRLKKCNPEIGFVAMHMHGNPLTMHLNPLSPAGAVKRVGAFFESAVEDLRSAGFQEEDILLDPGIGFGKNDGANIVLMAQCAHWSRTLPVAVGISRKGMFGRIFGVENPKDRDPVSKVTETALALVGVRMIRTHDVAALAKCMTLLEGALV